MASCINCTGIYKNLIVKAIVLSFFLQGKIYYLLFGKEEKLSFQGKIIISHTPMCKLGKPEN